MAGGNDVQYVSMKDNNALPTPGTGEAIIGSVNGVPMYGANGNPPTQISAAAGADPFSLMAARALAFGKGLGTPVNFAQYDPFQEDFTLGALTVASVTGGAGSVAYASSANSLGSHGLIQCNSSSTTSDFSIATAVNVRSYIGDMLASTYYLEFYGSFNGAATGNSSTHGIGIIQASGSVTGASRVVIAGLCGNGSAHPTNYGFFTYNGTASAFHAGGTAADTSGSTYHYFGLGHDATAHAFYFYVDGVQVDTISDAAMSGIGAATWAIYEQDTTTGSTLIDKVYMVST